MTQQIRIVCELPSEHVLGRMARSLADHAGWELSAKASAFADINYFIPYLSFEPTEAAAAAYFTHCETNDKGKTRRWQSVDKMVTGRIVTASRYKAQLLHPTAVVRPPIDMDKFRPALRVSRSGKPLIGVGGMVYKTGRKGEHLVEMLAQSALGREINLCASGRGWSVQTQKYDWGEMQAFYQSLDVFLCTSLIEGVPMPPLEALACGVPIVVPIGVGLLDDLADAIGIYRYQAGDYDGMVRALQDAIGMVTARLGRDAKRLISDQCRSYVVKNYTAENWAADHVAAFGEWFP
ncbi:MAG: glycosyltransferase family 4 protein [Chloroflexota bacterium]|nr:glycosyltransferase family 4 protein [Chloroflexota bacterium]